MKQIHKRFKVHCFGCDRARVEPNKKCPVCNARLYSACQRHNQKIKNRHKDGLQESCQD